MKVYTTVPMEDPREVPSTLQQLEDIGYDGGFSMEAKHDPFLVLAVAAQKTQRLALGTGVAIAFARNPMNLANIGWDLQCMSEGRFILGLGSQIKPHIEKRFSSTWSKPAARMREMVQAIRAIWDCWEGKRPLDFQGEFYQHTLMTPAFNPGPNPFGPPRIFTGGFGPLMTAVAGEVSDGFIAHPFATRRSLLENILPALEKGLAKAGRSRGDLEVMCNTFIVTADTEESLTRTKKITKEALAFYGSTPAYRPTLICNGWDGLHEELNSLSKQGRWEDMGELISDDMLDELAVVGERRQIADKLRTRLDGIADSVALLNTRCPDPGYWADVVKELKQTER